MRTFTSWSERSGRDKVRKMSHACSRFWPTPRASQFDIFVVKRPDPRPPGVKRACEYGREPQVPPLRFAPVGMTILSRGSNSDCRSSCGHTRIVIPTGAYPDFLLRNASNGHVCGSPQREPHGVHQRHGSRQEIRGSVVEGPAVLSTVLTQPLKPSTFFGTFPRV
jgi:hypothetical protein